MDQQQNAPTPKKKLSLAKLALLLDASVLVAALFILLSSFLSFLGLYALIFIIIFVLAIWIIAAPLCGIVLAILALTRKERTKSDTVCAILAIVLPVVIVLTLILLFSTGVIVIRFM